MTVAVGDSIVRHVPVFPPAYRRYQHESAAQTQGRARERRDHVLAHPDACGDPPALVAQLDLPDDVQAMFA